MAAVGRNVSGSTYLVVDSTLPLLPNACALVMITITTSLDHRCILVPLSPV